MRKDAGLSAPEQHMHEFLAEWNLERYASSLFDSGYDDLNYLQAQDSQNLSKIAQRVGMPVGHEERFIDALQQVHICARYL